MSGSLSALLGAALLSLGLAVPGSPAPTEARSQSGGALAAERLVQARERLEAGRPAAALALLAEAEPSVERSLLEAEILVRGSDPRRARAVAFAAAEGLATDDPARTTLLWWATNASLWLQDPAGSQRLAAALEASVAAAELGADRASWEGVAAGYAAAAEELVAAERRRARAVRRSKGVAAASLLAVGLLGLLLLRRRA